MEVKSKMPSTILSIDVQVGTAVTRGQTLCTIEAMKMKNPVAAPVDGIVKEIKVAVGDRLKPGALMMVIE